MIDIESQVFTAVATALRAEFPGIDVSSTYERVPASFPHVTITESDNYLPTATLDSSHTEKFAALMYEVNVYSNKTSGRKSEARAIAKVVDDVMYSLNFVRTSQTPAPNLYEANVYRIVARYNATTDGTNIFRRY